MASVVVLVAAKSIDILKDALRDSLSFNLTWEDPKSGGAFLTGNNVGKQEIHVAIQGEQKTKKKEERREDPNTVVDYKSADFTVLQKCMHTVKVNEGQLRQLMLAESLVVWPLEELAAETKSGARHAEWMVVTKLQFKRLHAEDKSDMEGTLEKCVRAMAQWGPPTALPPEMERIKSWCATHVCDFESGLLQRGICGQACLTLNARLVAEHTEKMIHMARNWVRDAYDFETTLAAGVRQQVQEYNRGVIAAAKLCLQGSDLPNMLIRSSPLNTKQWAAVCREIVKSCMILESTMRYPVRYVNGVVANPTSATLQDQGWRSRCLAANATFGGLVQFYLVSGPDTCSWALQSNMSVYTKTSANSMGTIDVRGGGGSGEWKQSAYSRFAEQAALNDNMRSSTLERGVFTTPPEELAQEAEEFVQSHVYRIHLYALAMWSLTEYQRQQDAARQQARGCCGGWFKGATVGATGGVPGAGVTVAFAFERPAIAGAAGNGWTRIEVPTDPQKEDLQLIRAASDLRRVYGNWPKRKSGLTPFEQCYVCSLAERKLVQIPQLEVRVSGRFACWARLSSGQNRESIGAADATYTADVEHLLMGSQIVLAKAVADFGDVDLCRYYDEQGDRWHQCMQASGAEFGKTNCLYVCSNLVTESHVNVNVQGQPEDGILMAVGL